MTTISTSTQISLTSSTTGLFLNTVDGLGVRWVVTKFDGWGAVKPTLQVVQKPRQQGGWAGLSFGQPRYLTLSVRVIAPDPGTLTASLDRFYAAADLNDTVLVVNEAGFSRRMIVRRSDEIVHTRINSTIADLQVQLVAADPRKLGTPIVQQTALPSSTGGVTVPFTVPFTINSTVVSGQVSMFNPGNEVGAVVLRIDGPCTGPVITHTSNTTSSAVFSSNLSLGAGEYLLVDMDKRTVLANGQTTRAGYVTSRGWSGFDPGQNTWSFTATAYNSGSLLTVTATPAWK